MLCFLTSTLFAEVDEMMIIRDPRAQKDEMPNKETEDEPIEQDSNPVLEEEIEPAPPPALIDLSTEEKADAKGGYASLYLLVFNIVMFTTGMLIVKTTKGSKV